MTRIDYIKTLIIGEIIALFVLLLLFTLSAEIPSNFSFVVKFKLSLLVILPIAGVFFISFVTKLHNNHFALSQFGKFCYVGLSNFTIDFGILNLLIYGTGFSSGVYFSVFKGLSFSFAVINSYYWNKFWTFKDRDGENMFSQFIKFFTLLGIGLILNVSIASYIVNKIEPITGFSPTLWANFGAIISLFFTLAWNFLSMKFVVFKR